MMNTQVRKYLLKKEKKICADHGYNMDDKYLGGGATGRVFLAEPTEQKIRTTEKLKLVKKEDEKLQVAIKIYYADVGAISIGGFATYLPAEIGNCNKCFGVPNIVMLLDVFVSCKRIFLVFEHAAKGDLTKTLYEHICGKPLDRLYLEEDLARHYFRQIAKGVQQLHRKNIAHRDLKPDNILVTGDGQIKLCDLGFSIAGCNKNKNTNSVVTSSPCGTPGFAAPEIFASRRHPYDPLKADVWSLGVILFLLTNGRYPFNGKTSQDIQKDILLSEGEPLPFRDGLSTECKELISRLLTSPKKRPTVHEIVRDQWLVEYKKQESPPSTKHLRNIADNLAYRFQATYVRNYLYQRKKLLLERRQYLLKTGYKAEDLRNAGIMISLPREDTAGIRVSEVWRFERNDSRETDNKTSSHDRKNTGKLKALKYCWAWCPGVNEPTLGVRLVERVVKDLPMLKGWAEILDNEYLAESGFERSLKNYNTIDVEGYKKKIESTAFHPQDKENELARARQNILGFFPNSHDEESEKERSKEESQVSEKRHKSGLGKTRRKEKLTKDDKSKEEVKLDTDKKYPTTAKKHKSPKGEKSTAVNLPRSRHVTDRPLPKVPGESYELLTDKLQLEHCRPYGSRPTRSNATTTNYKTQTTKVQTKISKIKQDQENLMKKLTARDQQKFKSLQKGSKASRENGPIVTPHQPRFTEKQLPGSDRKSQPRITESAAPKQAKPPLKHAEKKHVQEGNPKASDMVPPVKIKKIITPERLKIDQKSPMKAKESFTIPNVKTISSKDKISKKANNAALNSKAVNEFVKNSKPFRTQRLPKHEPCISEDNMLSNNKYPTASTLKPSNESCVAKWKTIQSERRQTTSCGKLLAPVAPSQEGNSSEAHKRRILKRQAVTNSCKEPNVSEVNLDHDQRDIYYSTHVVKQFKEPRPPKQDGEMSAARKRRILKRQTALKENKTEVSINKSVASLSVKVITKPGEFTAINKSQKGFIERQAHTSNGRQICYETVEATKNTSNAPLPIEQTSSSVKYVVAPTPPKQGNKFSAARKRRIANRQSAHMCDKIKDNTEVNLKPVSPTQQVKELTDINPKEPVPPKQNRNLSAARKRRTSRRRSSTALNNKDEENTLITSTSYDTLTTTGRRTKEKLDKQQHFKSERIYTTRARLLKAAKSTEDFSVPPCEITEFSRQQQRIAAADIVARNQGRTRRLRTLEERAADNVGLKPARPLTTKPVGVRKSGNLTITMQGVQPKTKVENVTHKPPLHPKEKKRRSTNDDTKQKLT